MKKPTVEYDLKITFSHEAMLEMCREYLKIIALPCAGHFDLAKGPAYYDPSIIATFVPSEPEAEVQEPDPLYTDAILKLHADKLDAATSLDGQIDMVKLATDICFPTPPAPAAADTSSEDYPF